MATCCCYQCNQSAYYESENGYCYFHWKQLETKLIPKGDRAFYLSKKDMELVSRKKKTKLFYEKLGLAGHVANKIHNKYRMFGGYPADADDLKQLASEYLWSTIHHIDTTLEDKQINKYIYRTLEGYLCNYLASMWNQMGTPESKLTRVYEIQQVSLDSGSETADNSNYSNYILYNILYNNNIIDKYNNIILLKQLNRYLYIYIKTLDTIDRQLFHQLFITDENIPLRTIATKVQKSHEFVRLRGQELLDKFKLMVMEEFIND